MKYRRLILLFLLAILSPLIINAKEYKDVVADIIGIQEQENVTVYFFHGNGCPHCASETILLKELKDKYGEKLNIVKYEVWYNSANNELYKKVQEQLNFKANGVPFTIVGEQIFDGYNNSIGEDIKNSVDSYIQGKNVNSDEKTLPFLGKINLKKVSIPIVAIILGFLDGFNPCAMWILLFLINMLFTMKDRKKMWILGFTFLLVSAFVYFLAMLGLNVVLSFATVNWIRALIGVVALTGGLINIRSYLKTPQDGCHIVDDKKRNKYFTKIKNFMSAKSFWISLMGVVTLAISVNLVELACSAGFPTIFVELLNINNLSLIQEIIYISIYVLFFLLDDLVVFVIAMTTLKLTGISTKYNRFSHLFGGILMILMGVLLIFKPEWLMFNFK